MSDLEPSPKKLAPRPIMVEALKQMRDLGADNPRIQEIHFREFLRAIFDPTTKTFDTALYFRTMGTLRKGIDVTDPAGRVLFTTPPIAGTIDTVFAAHERSLSTVVELAALNDRRHHLLGKKTLDDGLRQYRFGEAHNPRDQWVEILVKYGLVSKDELVGRKQNAAGDETPLIGHEEEL